MQGQKKVVLFSGPPGSGKDEAARTCVNLFGGNHLEFKDKLFDIALCVSGMYEDTWWDIYLNRTGEGPNKETPLPRLGGLSQRQFLIKISEEWVKPVFGPKYFGQKAAATIHQYKYGEKFFISDAGFVDEVEEVIDVVGKENVLLVRLYRKGCSFEGDSRNYIPFSVVDLGVDLYNNGTLTEFRDNVYRAVKCFIQ